MSIYSDAVLVDSPVLYWRLGEPSGTNANDETANNRDGTYTGSVTLAQAGALAGDANTAIRLPTASTGAYVTRADEAALTLAGATGMALEVWVKWDTAASARTWEAILTKGDNSWRLSRSSSTNDLAFTIDAGGFVNLTTTGVNVFDGLWHHVACVYDKANTDAFVYVDSVVRASNTSVASSDPLDNTQPFQVGSNSEAPTREWQGWIDEVALYAAPLSAARVLEHYTVGVTGPPPPIAPQIHVREKPPLRASIDIENPVGRHYRWADDEPAAANRPSGLRYSDTMPGGHETADCTLPRKPGVDYADLERLSNLRVLGVGGEPYWGGRLERAPRTSGDEVSVSPSGVGWVAHLDDDKSARTVYVDRDLSRWGDASVQRKLDVITAGEAWASGSIAAAGDPSTSAPGLFAQIDRLATPPAARVESWWYGGGADVGTVYVEFDARSNMTSTVDWDISLLASSTDTAAAGETLFDADGVDLAAAYYSVVAGRPYLVALFKYKGTHTGDGPWSGVFKSVAVYGATGLTGVGTNPVGFYASDIVRHAVQTWAPMLNIKPDSIQPSSFVIPHLAFTDLTTAGEIVKQASRFDLPDWGVWDDKEFVWHQPGARGRTWRLRIGPSQLEETGPQVDRLWESVIVSYQDVDGSTRTVGPPGSGANTESSDVKDYDPDNPANKLGIIRRALLQMGTSTAAGATEVGRRFLLESKQLDRSGKARVVGWAQDDRGVLHPFSAVRSGDYAVFVDANDTSARKIVRTEKDHDSRTCSLDLDAPPEALQALLERLGAVLIPLGL